MKFAAPFLHSICLAIFSVLLTQTAFATTPAVDSPDNVMASDGTFVNKVRITWNTVPIAENYRVYRCTTRGNTCGSPIGFTTGNNFDDKTASVGTEHWYRVKTCSPASFCSPFSTPDTGFRADSFKDAVDMLGNQLADLMSLLAGVNRITDRGSDTLQLSAMNLQIVDGSGSTESRTGLGNLVVGYNKERVLGLDCEVDDSFCNLRDGSHNVIIGDKHNFIKWGGLVIGLGNEISGEYASVSGGSFNKASGYAASVSGGRYNNASGASSSISGGEFNDAYGNIASISGGGNNLSGGYATSVSGGLQNSADGDGTTISGGKSNIASGIGSTVSGGMGKSATSDNCIVGDNGVDC